MARAFKSIIEANGGAWPMISWIASNLPTLGWSAILVAVGGFLYWLIQKSIAKGGTRDFLGPIKIRFSVPQGVRH
jgi:hypothetical protein